MMNSKGVKVSFSGAFFDVVVFPIAVAILILAAVLLLLGGPSAERAKGESSFGEASFAGNRDYVVLYKQKVDLGSRVKSELNKGNRVKDRFDSTINGALLELEAEDVNRLRQDDRVLAIEPDQPVWKVAQAQGVRPASSWGLDRIDERQRPLDGQIATAGDGSGVEAYIVDTGILLNHREFTGRINSSKGFTAITDGQGWNDCNGHGTHVAGTVGGSSYGVAPAVTLTAVRVLDCKGSGYTSGVIAGLDWIISDHRQGQPAVANMSLGGGFSNVENTAVQRTIDDGVTLVAAAGNETDDACKYSPSSAPNALTVGSTDREDAVSWFSNWGTCLDIFAPGSSIKSAWHTSTSATETISGTSMAAPHIAGAAALILERQPSKSPGDVANQLASSATRGVIRDLPIRSPDMFAYVGSNPATDPGSWGSGSISNLRPSSGGRHALQVSVTANSNVCTGAGYCGWYASASVFPATESCPSSMVNTGLFWTSSVQQEPKTVNGTADVYMPRSSPPWRFCIYLGSQSHLVYDGVISPQGGEPDDPGDPDPDPDGYGSGSVENLRYSGSGSLYEYTISATANSNVCDEAIDYCEWFPAAYVFPAATECSPSNQGGAYAWIGEIEDGPGTQTAEEDTYMPGDPPWRFCIYVNGADNEYHLVHEEVLSPEGDGPDDPGDPDPDGYGSGSVENLRYSNSGGYYEYTISATANSNVCGEAIDYCEWYPAAYVFPAATECSPSSLGGAYAWVGEIEDGPGTQTAEEYAYMPGDPPWRFCIYVNGADNEDHLVHEEVLSPEGDGPDEPAPDGYGSGYVEDLRYSGSGSIYEYTISATANSNVCDEAIDYCGWFPVAYVFPEATECSPSNQGGAYAWVGETEDRPGTQTAEEYAHMPGYAPWRFCIYVYSDREYHLVHEEILSPMGGGPGDPTRPSNDDFSEREPLELGGVEGDSTGATAESGEPFHFNFEEPSASVWWEWMAPQNGTVVLDTSGSDFDTLLAVYTGSSLDSLSKRASDDDSGDGLASQLSLEVTSGSTYAVVVDGVRGANGNLRLNGSFEPEETPGDPPSTSPPKPRITSGPAVVTKSRKARFTFSGVRNARFQCRLDGRGYWSACRSPLVYRRLMPGRHILRVRQVRSGKESAAATYSWTILRSRR